MKTELYWTFMIVVNAFNSVKFFIEDISKMCLHSGIATIVLSRELPLWTLKKPLHINFHVSVINDGYTVCTTKTLAAGDVNIKPNTEWW